MESTVTAVFHRECAGISKAEIKKTPLIACSQHACSSCGRSTQQSGGMLFRYVCGFCLNEINTFYATHPQMSDLPQSVLWRLPSHRRDWCYRRCPPRIVSKTCFLLLHLFSLTLSPSALLGYPAKDTVYYIRCHDCHEYFREHPEVWQGWQEEIRETQLKFEAWCEEH